jgi:hypothetical protein
VKRSPIATARRTVRRAGTWRPKSSPQETVDIRRLISPLRYDVLIRAQLFDLVRESGHGAPGSSPDLDQLVAAAHDSAYFVWFRDVAMTRFRPWVLKDPDLLEQQFRERVESAAALYRSFSDRGFDPAHPVTLRGVRKPLSTDSGLRLDRQLHVGDGGHRLALLLSAGQGLQPGAYRVDRRPQAQLIDNTAVLVPALRLARDEYVRFLAQGYGLDTDDLDALLDQLRGRGDGSDQEAAAVASHHLGLLVAPDGGRA